MVIRELGELEEKFRRFDAALASGERSFYRPEDDDEMRRMLVNYLIVIERRNWYLSNAFLPGYWPHSALYIGTAEELRAMGFEADPRVAKHLAAFARPDAAGHVPAFIEAVSEGVEGIDLAAGADVAADVKRREFRL